MACTTEHGMQCITEGALQRASVQSAVGLHVADSRLNKKWLGKFEQGAKWKDLLI